MSRHSSQPVHFPLMVGFMKILHGKRRSANQGLTIMECLVAILLIGLTTAMITPPLVVATATRVQNRRAEQALQIAQDEVDRISTMVQQGVHRASVLPDVAGGANLKSVPAPTSLGSYFKTSRRDGCAAKGTTYNYQGIIAANQALPIDVDGDCDEDFFMQVFRTEGVFTEGERNRPLPGDRRPAQFSLGVRVYSKLARNNLSTGKLQTEPASLQITEGQGKQASNPLTVVYKPIIWSEQSDALCSSLSAQARASLPACE